MYLLYLMLISVVNDVVFVNLMLRLQFFVHYCITFVSSAFYYFIH